MDKMQKCIYDNIIAMSGEMVANAFLDYHGLQLLNEGFYEYLVEEGYMCDDPGILDEEFDSDD